MNTMTRLRKSTSAKLRALEVPDAFASATIATAARATYRNATTPGDRRRAVTKAARVLATLATLAAPGCGGRVTEDDPLTRYAHDACECATTPCDPAAIVAAFRAATPDIACVVAYAEAMETRTTCDATPPMPTCEPIPGAAAARYARAVCACQGDPRGCFANAYGEAFGANAACLTQRAAGYEIDCTGRSGDGCTL